MTALCVLAFMVANALTYHQFVTSHERVRARRPAGGSGRRVLLSLLGGSPAALFATRRLYTQREFPVSRPVLWLMSALYVTTLGWLIFYHIQRIG